MSIKNLLINDKSFILSKSIEITPDILEQNKTSTAKAVWMCEKHGEYIQSISSHLLGRQGCSKCNTINRRKKHELRSNKWLMQQLNLEESLKIDPNILSENVTSRQNAVWICSKHGNYTQKIQYRLYGYVGCTFCDKENKYGSRTKYITDSKIKEFIEYDEFRSNNIDPSKIKISSTDKVWVKCNKGHKWSAQARSLIKTECGCPICLRRKDTRLDSLDALRPDLVKFYSSDNKYNASEVGVNSLDKVNWICKNGHKFIADIHTQNSLSYPADNVRCPFCSGLKRIKGSNTFADFNKDIMDEWYTEKNAEINLDPYSLPIYSNVKAWWKCRKNSNHIWETSLTIRSNGCGCPYCFRSRQTSRQEIAICILLRKMNLLVNNRVKIDGVEFDVECSDTNTLIEYHGMAWHDRLVSNRDILKHSIASSIGKDFIIIREVRNTDYDVLFTKENDINTILYNIGKNYETFHILADSIIKLFKEVYKVNAPNIDTTNLLKSVTEFINNEE